MRPLPSPEDILRSTRVIAVLGAHPDTSRPAFYVPDYLYRQGYRILPVNPRYADIHLWGEPVKASLDAIEEPIDMVDVFRNAAALPDHLEEISRMQPRPRVVWLQLGIQHDGFAKALIEMEIDVIQNRCTLADHRRLGIAPIKGNA